MQSLASYRSLHFYAIIFQCQLKKYL